jgi:ribosomal protein S18 acetylase RimI-like enzyme
LGAVGVIVRVCGAEDVPAVLGLWSLARSVHAITPDRAGDLERLVTEMPGSLLLAENGGIIGALIAGWDGWRGNMYRLAVHPDHRRRGVGLQLVSAGEARLRELGARRVTALVGRDDTVAAAFWDVAGYPIDHEIGRRVRNLQGTGGGP